MHFEQVGHGGCGGDGGGVCGFTGVEPDGGNSEGFAAFYIRGQTVADDCGIGFIRARDVLKAIGEKLARRLFGADLF